MAKSRRSFTREYKIEAVKLVTEKGQSIAEAARSLGIHENQLRTWKKALENELQGEQPAFPGHGNRPALEQEIHQLKQENRRLLMERDILYEGASTFSALTSRKNDDPGVPATAQAERGGYREPRFNSKKEVGCSE